MLRHRDGPGVRGPPPFRVGLGLGWVDLRGKLPTRPGAEPYLRRTLAEMHQVIWLVYHHTHKGPGRPTVQSIAEYQTGPTAHLPFPATAYHVYVEEDGTMEWVQDLETVTWSQGDGSPTVKGGVGSNNWLGIACCFSGENPTEAQITSMKRVGDVIDTGMERKLERVGHRDVSRGPDGAPLTECPGVAYVNWLPRIR